MKTIRAVTPSAGRATVGEGAGTGFAFDTEGHILTNYHVIENSTEIQLLMDGGRTVPATLIGTAPLLDIAVLKPEAGSGDGTPLQSLPFGDSDGLDVGQKVLAIGNPFGFHNTLTVGVLSGVARDLPGGAPDLEQVFLQTDAAINPGNSGGPLLNCNGEVIGINVAIRAGAQKIGFAIPIDDARKVIARLLDIERLENNYHGLRAEDYKLGMDRKLIVSATAPGSPAAAAGLQPGDVIERAGTISVVDMADFERSVLGRNPGESVPVTVRRGGEAQTFQLQITARGNRTNAQLAARTTTLPVPPQAPQEQGKSWTMLGMQLRALSPRERSAVNPRYKGGMKVVSVRNEGPAERNGIKEGDILVGLHVWETISPENVDFVVSHPQLGKFNPLKFYIVRETETLYGYLQLPSSR
ncbi:MAG: trypsin-like peptidase domain-containing protein [Planctomycetaceae bacterium]|nr:trypsin-like peptidase domain-containing protein [Planctomycetaceae bacterium]